MTSVNIQRPGKKAVLCPVPSAWDPLGPFLWKGPLCLGKLDSIERSFVPRQVVTLRVLSTDSLFLELSLVETLFLTSWPKCVQQDKPFFWGGYVTGPLRTEVTDTWSCYVSVCLFSLGVQQSLRAVDSVYVYASKWHSVADVAWPIYGSCVRVCCMDVVRDGGEPWCTNMANVCVSYNSHPSHVFQVNVGKYVRVCSCVTPITHSIVVLFEVFGHKHFVSCQEILWIKTDKGIIRKIIKLNITKHLCSFPFLAGNANVLHSNKAEVALFVLLSIL